MVSDSKFGKIAIPKATAKRGISKLEVFNLQDLRQTVGTIYRANEYVSFSRRKALSITLWKQEKETRI